jgi:hypothetical protein
VQSHLDAVPAGLRPISGLPQPRIRRVTRGRMAALLAAATAVSARTPEAEFLRARHDVYRGLAPRDVTAPLPDTEISSTGMFVVAEIDRRHPADRVFDGPMDGARNDVIRAEIDFQRAAADAAAAEIARTAAAIDEDVQRIGRQDREISEQLDRLAEERNDSDADRTHAIESGRVDLTPPPMPSAAEILWLRLSVLGMISAESIAFFFAAANMNGIDPTALHTEWSLGAGVPIVASAVVACFVAGSAFILAEAARRHLAEALRAGASHRTFERWAAVLVVLVTAILLIEIAAVRADLGTAGQTNAATTVRYLVFAAVPLIAGVYLRADAQRRADERRAALTRAATPDARDVAARHRREQEARLVEERDHLRGQREMLIAKRNALNASVFSGDQLRRDLARHEKLVVDIFLDTFRAAISIDRAAYRLAARTFRRDYLLVSPEVAEQSGALVPIRRRRSA